KVPPNKPHFFKPILPGFKNGGIKIPTGFLKYLKGCKINEHAILKRGGTKWPVKVNGRQFEAGWAEFAEEHDLQLGDMLVFRHEGNMEFDVSIFGSSHCEKEYAAYMQEDEEEETPRNLKIKLYINLMMLFFKLNGSFILFFCIIFLTNATEKPKANIKTSGKAFPNVEAASKEIHISHSHLICTIRPYCLSRDFLLIPKQFALDNRLNNRKCTIIMRDERRSWTL
ncbi:b3 domain-containing protein rem10, partial [Nicotiana attenuata]